jgi:hypothetical protein
MAERGYQLTNVVEALRVEGDVAAGDFEHEAWSRARPVELARYWSGEEAPPERRASARLLWSAEALVARFECRQHEPLVVSAAPRLDHKTIGLWDRDVCEVFVAPDPAAPHRYFEFEAAPTGEWLDLAVTLSPRGRETDWHYRSGMTAAARASGHSLTVGLRVPWRALGGAPDPGQRWRANLYRCVGSDPDRGYLAWQPTHTPEPGFHVPEKFGWIKFKT